jgi:hypothetical protein
MRQSAASTWSISMVRTPEVRQDDGGVGTAGMYCWGRKDAEGRSNNNKILDQV